MANLLGFISPALKHRANENEDALKYIENILLLVFLLDESLQGPIILKTAVSHRGTETTEAADKQLYLRKALKNCDPLG